MPPKPRQLRAPRPKQSGNAFQALVDLAEDGSNSTFDGRDGKVDESDGFSAGNTLQRVPSAASEAPPPPPRYTTNYGESPVRKWRTELVNEGVHAYVLGAEIDCSAENIVQYCTANATIGAHLEWLIEQRTGAIGDEMECAFQTVFDKLDNLTKKVDKMALEEVALCKAYHQSAAETAVLKATVHTLTKQLNEHIIFPALPLPDPVTSPSAMEEMMLQLSHVQHDIPASNDSPEPSLRTPTDRSSAPRWVRASTSPQAYTTQFARSYPWETRLRSSTWSSEQCRNASGRATATYARTDSAAAGSTYSRTTRQR
jgi:hypothetical protein